MGWQSPALWTPGISPSTAMLCTVATILMCKHYVHASAIPLDTRTHSPSTSGDQHVGRLNRVSMHVSSFYLSFTRRRKNIVARIYITIYIYIYI